MKKAILGAFMMSAVCLGVYATGNVDKVSEEKVIRPLTKAEVNSFRSDFANFSDITSMKLVEVKDLKFVRVTGTGVEGEALTQMVAASDCGECTYWDKINGKPVLVEGIKFNTNCIECSVDSNPGPF